MDGGEEGINSGKKVGVKRDLERGIRPDETLTRKVEKGKRGKKAGVKNHGEGAWLWKTFGVVGPGAKKKGKMGRVLVQEWRRASRWGQKLKNQIRPEKGVGLVKTKRVRKRPKKFGVFRKRTATHRGRTKKKQKRKERYSKEQIRRKKGKG